MTYRDPFNIAVAEELQSLREARNLTPEQFAELIGISPGYYNDIETAEWGMTVSTLLRIAKAINESPEALVTEIRTRLPGDST